MSRRKRPGPGAVFKGFLLAGQRAQASVDALTLPALPDRSHVVGGQGEPLTALVRLPVQAGAPLTRALVVDRTTHGVDVHFECSSDGVLLVRISGRAS